MSRFAAVFALLFVAVASIGIWQMPASVQAHATRGDVNCSDNVDSIDASIVLQYDARLIQTYDCASQGDTNGDSRSDSLDASLILQFSAALISELGPQGVGGECPDGYYWHEGEGHCEPETCPPGLIMNPDTLHCELPKP
jgi:hypothetical protein